MPAISEAGAVTSEEAAPGFSGFRGSGEVSNGDGGLRGAGAVANVSTGDAAA